MDMLRPASDPFQADGGMRLVAGNIGRGVFKTSAVDEERWLIEAPARCFSDQNEVLEAFKAGELDRDVAVIVRFQGPRANGMPEMYFATAIIAADPALAHTTAIVTDGRFSGAAKGPAVGHVTPEALDGGGLAAIRTADWIYLDLSKGEFQVVAQTNRHRGYKALQPRELTNRPDRKKRINELERRRHEFLPSFRVILDQISSAETGVSPTAKAD